MSQRFGNWRKYAREGSAALALVMLLVVVGMVAPSFFTVANLRDLVLGNLPVFIVAAGMTILIIAGHIDISVGAQFACASVAAGWLAKSGLPVWLLIPLIAVFGGLIGALNGLLVARFNMPSIVVTLAMMVALRDSLRWITAGEWVQGLPGDFQWFGLGQTAGEWMIMLTAAAICGFFMWSLANLSSGRAIYAVGSDREAARLAGIAPVRVIFFSFTLMGLLTGIAALLNSIRFAEVQGNAGVGLELKAIAAVVVGGTAIRGGRGMVAGTVLGVALLGTISTALTFVGVSAFWEKAVQGAIILAAVASDVLFTGKFRVKALQTEQAKA
jgi:rhamnose transport system permease protein